MKALSSVRDWAQSDIGRKAVRYSLVSVVAVVVSEISLGFFYGILHWTARSSNITAAVIGGVPSYYLNRTWAWGKTGKSHLWKEVVPFWTLAFLGLAFSTWAADAGDHFAKAHLTDHLFRTAFVMGSSLSAYGILWIAKFILFNKVIFASHPQDLDDEPALDGRTGVPT